MARVTVSPGCTGLDMADGTRYTAPRQGGHIEVADRHATAIRRGWYGSTGIIATSQAVTLGTKTGRRCEPCRRTWNAWNTHCVKCGLPTTKENNS